MELALQEGVGSQLGLSTGAEQVNCIEKGEVYSTYEVNCGFLVPLLVPRAAEEVLFGKEGVTLQTSAAVRSLSLRPSILFLSLPFFNPYVPFSPFVCFLAFARYDPVLSFHSLGFNIVLPTTLVVLSFSSTVTLAGNIAEECAKLCANYGQTFFDVC